MLWVMKLVEKMEDRLAKILKPKKCDGMKLLKIGIVLIGILSLIPLFGVGFYNHMSGDDWYNARFVYHQVSGDSFSLIQMFKDIFADVIDLYTRWSFTYTGYMMCYLMPAGFGEQFTWLHTVILLTGTVVCMYVVFNKCLGKLLGLDKNARQIASVVLILVLIQYMPSAFDGFYWWSGSANNTLGFAISLLDIVFLLRLYCDEKKVKIGNWVVFGISLFLIAGTSYATVLVLFCSMFLILLDVILFKKREKRERIILSAMFVWYIISILFAMTAPGNARRSEALGDVGYSPIKAIIHAYIAGLKLIYERFNVFILLAIIIVCLLALPKLIETRKQFKNPLVVLFVTYSIFITSFIPTLYAQGISGEPRVRNIQYWYCIICITINAIYFLGWYLKKKGISSESAFLTKFKKEAILILLAGGMLFMLVGEVEPVSKVALKDVLMGTIQQFDSELDDREEMYRTSTGQEVVAEQLSVNPRIFEGYTDLREEKFWINSNVRDYYKLARLRSSVNGEIIE